MKDFPRVNEPFKWTSIIRKAITIYAQGSTQQKAADEAGMSRTHLSLCMKHPECQALYEEVIFKTGLALRSELVKSMKMLCARKIEDCMENGDKDTALQYMKEIRTMLALDDVKEDKRDVTFRIIKDE